MSQQKSDIILSIGLDEEQIPETITWQAEQDGSAPKECKAFLLSIFEKETKETLKIDLWTKDLEVQEMDRFFYHTLKSLVQTYHRSTNNDKLASAMSQFVDYFGKEIGFLAE